MKSVLLIAPTFLNLYIDLKIEWEKRGYNVTYIEEESYFFITLTGFPATTQKEGTS